MILAHDVVKQLIPFFRYVVAADFAGIPIRQHGEIEPIGWCLAWRLTPQNLVIELAMPVGLEVSERQEVVLTVARIPTITGATIGGKCQSLKITVCREPKLLQELAYWMDRWQSEVDHDY